ncbi:helix-turn-helix domain-containing protein [Ideonella sp. DXS29W]|uniref:Helix-turn-helix domain-containing protein n=1 Tax=Ideonella lacteola TaxID=2984193 RepID=A0ABU9BRA8_9BURK
MSLSDAPPNLPLSPCAAAKAASGCGSSSAEADARPGYEAESINGRVVVCHRSKQDAQSLCIVSSAKERSQDELLALLKTLLPYVDDAFQRIEPESAHPSEASSASCGASGIHALTAREKEVLYWTAQGKGCWETGHIVGISERTVKFHLQNIYRKLNVVNRAQAVARAAQIQLLPAAA